MCKKENEKKDNVPAIIIPACTPWNFMRLPSNVFGIHPTCRCTLARFRYQSRILCTCVRASAISTISHRREMFSGITATCVVCLSQPNIAARICSTGEVAALSCLIKFDLHFIKRPHTERAIPETLNVRARLSNRRDLFGARTCSARAIKFYNAVKL